MAPKSWYVQENRPSVTICALSLIIIGILLIFAGGLVTYIYFTEITPPNYEAYYQRYVGSSFPRIVGILILMAGLTLFWGASIFLVYVHYTGTSSPHQGRYYFNGTSTMSPNVLPTTATTSSYPARRSVVVKEAYIA